MATDTARSCKQFHYTASIGRFLVVPTISTRRVLCNRAEVAWSLRTAMNVGPLHKGRVSRDSEL